MDEKAQTSFEYILLLAGILSVIALVYLLLRTGPIQGGKDQVNASYTNYQNATNTSGYV
ncbi:MAG: class III signal peptide-containing protein [Candidatus Micrarchaeota archaeon]